MLTCILDGVGAAHQNKLNILIIYGLCIQYRICQCTLKTRITDIVVRKSQICKALPIKGMINLSLNSLISLCLKSMFNEDRTSFPEAAEK